MSAATIFNAQELHFEDDISRNPYNLKSWLSYLTFMKGAKSAKRYMIYERALKHLPRSYKLWFAYLMERVEGMKERKVDDSRGTILTNTFERALVQMNKMPRIWQEYCKHLISIKKGTETRKAFDRALQSLPITQHKDLWELYIDWAKEFGVAETTVRVFRRYLMYDASKREHFVTYLESIGQVGEAALQLAVCVNDEHYLSPTGASKHQLWMRLCDMCAAHPDAVSSNLKVESIIRSGIARFSDEVGRLWCKLADFYVRQGQFEKSRDIYEEALSSVTTVKDFSIVFDAYVRVEEGVLSAKLRGDDDDDDDEDGALGDDTEMRLARLEYLLEKRPILLNSVVLRQNPNNVFEWHKRVKLFKGDTKLTLIAYMEGVKTVDPKYATGKLNGLWISFAKFYEKSGDLDSARTVFQRAVKVNFKSVEELANVWCGWGEMEMRHEEYDAALQVWILCVLVRIILFVYDCTHISIPWCYGLRLAHTSSLCVCSHDDYIISSSLQVMQQAVAEPTATARRRKQEAQKMGKGMSESEIQADSVVQDRVHRNVKIWALYLDLEESLGTFAILHVCHFLCARLRYV
jgi:pre-mRNA-splicing factor SYF1